MWYTCITCQCTASYTLKHTHIHVITLWRSWYTDTHAYTQTFLFPSWRGKKSGPRVRSRIVALEHYVMTWYTHLHTRAYSIIFRFPPDRSGQKSGPRVRSRIVALEQCVMTWYTHLHTRAYSNICVSLFTGQEKWTHGNSCGLSIWGSGKHRIWVSHITFMSKAGHM